MPKVNIGDEIEIIQMLGEPRYTGKRGTVEHIDDSGQVHGTWGGLALQPDKDNFEVVRKKEDHGKQ